MVERKRPLIAMLGNTQIPDSQAGMGSSGGIGFKELLADISKANKGTDSSIGTRNGEKSSKPFLDRLLGGF